MPDRAFTVVVAALLIVSCSDGPPPISLQGSHFVTGLADTSQSWRATAVLLAAGDIARCGSNGDEATARLLDSLPGTVLSLGDHVYAEDGPADFAACYEPSWGRHRARTRPAPGNHEYKVPGAKAYFDYFGDAAGPRGQGYYSFDVGGWHIISLNSNVDMRDGSAQERWLRADLAAHPARCTLAFSHAARFSSGRDHGSIRALSPLWRALYAANVDVVVQAHDHLYERLARVTPNGQPDPRRGIRSFVVGTGGAGVDRFSRRPVRASEVRYNGGPGVLKLELRPDGYAWEFITADGNSFSDRGQGECH
jgi:acid phosphatase type 7